MLSQSVLNPLCYPDSLDPSEQRLVFSSVPEINAWSRAGFPSHGLPLCLLAGQDTPRFEEDTQVIRQETPNSAGKWEDNV